MIKQQLNSLQNRIFELVYFLVPDVACNTSRVCTQTIENQNQKMNANAGKFNVKKKAL